MKETSEEEIGESSGSPIAIALLCLVGVVGAGMVGGYTYNYATGKRGMHAVPGYSFFANKSSLGDNYSSVKP